MVTPFAYTHKGPHPAPWDGREEPHPIGDTGDNDMPFVIRDANGHEVLTIYEVYGAQMEPLHEVVGLRIIRAINAQEKK
jgi:hypothetical protein